MVLNMDLKWEKVQAKNKEQTLILNDYQLYSNYRPRESAFQWVKSELDEEANEYILIGLGLGYHLEYLLKLTDTKQVYVYYFDNTELQIFKENTNLTSSQLNSVELRNSFEGIKIDNNIQVLIPHTWIKAIGDKHPLYNILEVIKLTQVSYKRAKNLMSENFELNVLEGNETITKGIKHKVGCLVAAGPSLDKTVTWLKEFQSLVDIYVVGAALKTVLAHEISPTGVVISDANEILKSQFQGLKYEGPLFYLSTANSETVKSLSGKKYILFQKGFYLAEEFASQKSIPLIESGGSVGTVTFSLMEQLGYRTIILFGQDLGFPNNTTHAKASSSNTEIDINVIRKKVEANDGSMINTNLMLYSFWNWYEEKCKSSLLKIYSTAVKGAKISNVNLIDKEQFQKIIRDNN